MPMVKKLLHITALALSIYWSSAALAQNPPPEALDKEAFQAYVMEYINAQAPAGGVKIEQLTIGLQNLYRKYERKSMAEQDINAMVYGYFRELFENQALESKPETLSWMVARRLLRPQLAPIDYLKKIDAPYKKLDRSVAVSYVIDNTSGYSYITEKDIERWDVDMDDIEEMAVENLDRISKDIPMQVSLEGDRFIIVQVLDGYDAARILIPSFRRFISYNLGDPFLAAVPTRDMLIMWSTDNSNISHRFVRRKISREYSEQFYPLSDTIFSVTSQKIRISR